MTDKKGGIFGALKGVFVEDVPDRQAAPRNTPLPAAPVAPPQYHSASVAGHVDVDPAIVAKIQQRIAAATPAAYSAFMDQYAQLKDIIPDEGTRFRAALKTSKTSVEQLVGSLDQMLSTVAQANQEFVATFEESKNRKLADAEASVKASDDLIKTSEEQMRLLQEKIATIRTTREAALQNMQTEAARLDGVKAGWDAAMTQVAGELNTFKSRVAAMPKV